MFAYIATMCSTTKLISAYQNSCESLGIKPIRKLLIQLQVNIEQCIVVYGNLIYLYFFIYCDTSNCVMC